MLAVATAEGPALARTTPKSVHFSGYDWEIREAASDRGGTRNQYDAGNAWTDKKGFLHLRVLRQGDTWTSAEVSLTRSLGYGSYRFVTSDVSAVGTGHRPQLLHVGRWRPAPRNGYRNQPLGRVRR